MYFSFSIFLFEFNNFKAKHISKKPISSYYKHEHSISKNSLSIYYQNVRGLRTKIFNFNSNLLLLQYGIFVLTETWLSDEISSAEFFSSNYLVFRCDINKNNNNKTRGGGVLIVIKKSFRSLIFSPQSEKVEQVFVKFMLSSQLSVLISGVYIPPSASVEVYESHVTEIDTIYQSDAYDIAIVCGDFNLPGVIWDKKEDNLIFKGKINDKVRVIGDKYAFLNLAQNNVIKHKMVLFLTLCFLIPILIFNIL